MNDPLIGQTINRYQICRCWAAEGWVRFIAGAILLYSAM